MTLLRQVFRVIRDVTVRHHCCSNQTALTGRQKSISLSGSEGAPVCVRTYVRVSVIASVFTGRACMSEYVRACLNVCMVACVLAYVCRRVYVYRRASASYVRMIVLFTVIVVRYCRYYVNV